MRRSWKKQWMRELDERTPKLREDVLNAPISTAKTLENQEIKANKATKQRSARAYFEKLAAHIRARKRLLMRVSATVASILLCFTMLMPFLSKTENVPILHVGAYALEINPRAIFTVNDKGIVTAVVAANEDADAILASTTRKDSMERKPIAKAMETFVDYAARLGFLDLDNGDVIRVSLCDERGNVQAIRQRLTDYFCKNGIYAAVVTEEVSVQTFCARMGELPHKSLETLVRSMETTPMLYAQQEAEGKSVAELQTLYEENFSQENVKTAVGELLDSTVNFIKTREKSLQKISEVNDRIKAHEENPATLWKDYWSVQDFYKKEDYTFSFSVLMLAMKELVEEHENLYQVKIRSERDLNDLILDASSTYLEDIIALLADFSMEVFNGSTELLTTALGWFGVDVDLVSLCEKPETKEEYLKKTKQYQEMRYRSLRTGNLTAYNTARKAITAEEYLDYEKSICAEYGSLEGYWQALNG